MSTPETYALDHSGGGSAGPVVARRLGADDVSDVVVTPGARVRGVTGLSVIDAPVFPDAVSAATIALAERFAARKN